MRAVAPILSRRTGQSSRCDGCSSPPFSQSLRSQRCSPESRRTPDTRYAESTYRPPRIGGLSENHRMHKALASQRAGDDMRVVPGQGRDPLCRDRAARDRDRTIASHGSAAAASRRETLPEGLIYVPGYLTEGPGRDVLAVLDVRSAPVRAARHAITAAGAQLRRLSGRRRIRPRPGGAHPCQIGALRSTPLLRTRPERKLSILTRGTGTCQVK
jgi:hypothetical protein